MLVSRNTSFLLEWRIFRGYVRKSPFSIGNTSSTGPFSIAMLVYRRVIHFIGQIESSAHLKTDEIPMGKSFVVETDMNDMIWTGNMAKTQVFNPKIALKNVFKKSWIQIWHQQQKTLGCPNRHLNKNKNTIILLWRETPCRSCEAGAPNPNKSTIGSPWRCNTIPAEFPPHVPRWRRRCRRSSAKLLRPF